jgi:hypothetical protein
MHVKFCVVYDHKKRSYLCFQKLRFVGTEMKQILQKTSIMASAVVIWLTGNQQQKSNEISYLYLGTAAVYSISSTQETEVPSCNSINLTYAQDVSDCHYIDINDKMIFFRCSSTL